jgi:hypothetical protein
MYFGSDVLFFPWSTLAPRAPFVRAKTTVPWQMAPTGMPFSKASATLAKSASASKYWRMPGA